MNETEVDKHNDDAVDSTKTVEYHLIQNRSAPKVTTDEPEISAREKQSHKNTLEKEEDIQVTHITNQEVPGKSKKRRAPRINGLKPIGELIKKKKSKAPKSLPPPFDDEFQVIENPAVDETPPYIDPKSKPPTIQIVNDSFEEIQVTNLDDLSPTNSDENFATFPPPPTPSEDENINDYQKSITDSYNNFSQYVDDDQWDLNHLPKSDPIEPKSRLRRILTSVNKHSKSDHQKSSLLSRLSSGLNTLVLDEKNLMFGKKPIHNEDEDDDSDHYAQQLHNVEDHINPEFLVLHDGETINGVYEPDANDKGQLAKRKPIYDRHGDQRPDEYIEKKKFLSHLKLPFTRHKDRRRKESKSADTTPDPGRHHKSSRKSLNDNMTSIPITDL